MDLTMLESELSFLGILVRSGLEEVSSFILNLNLYSSEVAGKVCHRDCEVENNDVSVIEARNCKAEDSHIEQGNRTNANYNNQKQIDDSEQATWAGSNLTVCEAEASDIEKGSLTETNDNDVKVEICNEQAVWYGGSSEGFKAKVSDTKQENRTEINHDDSKADTIQAKGSFEDSEAETYDVGKQGISTEGGHNGKTKSYDYKKVHCESWFQMWKFILDNFTISVTFLLLLGLVTGSDANIVEGPQNIAISKDDWAEMKCRSDTAKERRLEWSAVEPRTERGWTIYDGHNINPKFTYDFNISNGIPGQCDLRIKAAKPTAMKYNCIDEGDGTHIRSAELIVLESEPQCHAMEHNTKVNCTVSYSGNWPPTIIWKDSDGRDVTESALLHLVPNEYVTSVLNVSAREWKSYTCEVKFTKGGYSGNVTAKNVPKCTRECEVERDEHPVTMYARSSSATCTFSAMNQPILLIFCYIWFHWHENV